MIKEEFEMPEIIERENFRLEKVNMNRVEEMFNAVDENREMIGEFLSWVPYVKEVKDSADFISKELVKWNENKAFVYMIIDKQSNKLAGLIDLHKVSLKNRSGDFGYWLSKDYSKKGFMTNSVKALEEVLFSKGFHRLVIRAVDTNMNSRNVAIRLGYKEEAILRDKEYLYDRFFNHVLYSKLSND